jgi:hypothetical protein
VSCANCGEPFSCIGSASGRRLYCSWDPCTLAAHKKRRQAPRPFICEFCGEPAVQTKHHETPQRFCTRGCARLAYNGEQRAKAAEAPAWPSLDVARADLLRTVGRCQQCGWSDLVELLELGFVNLNRRNLRQDNLQLRCPTCAAVHKHRRKARADASAPPAAGDR